ncbi:hypothetical protein QZH41_003589 [Actinostola sp. cb2023]|nr:hypothetical protein QZH41_003589 [Actinostola sp. cb2023]
MLALMLKVCKYSLYGCLDVKSLSNEEDERPTLVCTSTLQKWNKKRDEGVCAQPLMEVTVSKTNFDGKKRPGITSQLYEARRNNSNFDESLKSFMASLNRIDPKLGLVQVGSTPAPSVETQYGKCPVGSYGSYQLGYTESNFKVWENLETVQRRDIDMAAEFPSYPSFPLHDFNVGYDLPIPCNLNDTEKTKLNSLKFEAFLLKEGSIFIELVDHILTDIGLTANLFVFLDLFVFDRLIIYTGFPFLWTR